MSRPASADRPPEVVMYADLFTDTEKRPDHRRQTEGRTATNSDTHLGASVNTQHTASELAREWHPTWCQPDGCGSETVPEDRHHDGPLITFPRSGVEFTFQCRQFAIGTPDSEFPVNRGLEIEVSSTVYADQYTRFHGTTDEMRDLADFIFSEADRLDAWAEEQGLCDA